LHAHQDLLSHRVPFLRHGEAAALRPVSAERDRRRPRAPDEARKLHAAGKDSSAKRRLNKVAANVVAGNTFGVIAAEYMEPLMQKLVK
jgi:hypothetical protein